MNTLYDIASSLQKRFATESAYSKLSLVDQIASSFHNRNAMMNLSTVNAVSSIAAQMSRQFEPKNNIAAALTSSMQEFSYENQFAFRSISASLSELNKYNPRVSDSLAGIVNSNLFMTSAVSQLARIVHNSHLNKFDSLSVAINNISKTYLNHINRTRSWEDLYVIEEASQTIAEVTGEFISDQQQITQQDLDRLREEMVDHFQDLIEKTTKSKTRVFLIDLLTVVSFLLTLYGTIQSENQPTNQDVIDQTKIEFQNFKTEVKDLITAEFTKLQRQRIATTDVNLRFSAKKRSQKIGLVKCGQLVTVIDIQHKWLLISFIDNETKEPKSGFVYKKYFERK